MTGVDQQVGYVNGLIMCSVWSQSFFHWSRGRGLAMSWVRNHWLLRNVKLLPRWKSLVGKANKHGKMCKKAVSLLGTSCTTTQLQEDQPISSTLLGAGWPFTSGTPSARTSFPTQSAWPLRRIFQPPTKALPIGWVLRLPAFGRTRGSISMWMVMELGLRCVLRIINTMVGRWFAGSMTLSGYSGL